MKQCTYKGCRSYAFNLQHDGINQGDLCDVHYYKQQRDELANAPWLSQVHVLCNDLNVKHGHIEDRLFEAIGRVETLLDALEIISESEICPAVLAQVAINAIKEVEK